MGLLSLGWAAQRGLGICNSGVDLEGGRWSSYPLIRFPMTKYEPADLRFALGLELIVLSLHES